ncbi:MAG: ion transporter [bacterium]
MSKIKSFVYDLFYNEEKRKWYYHIDNYFINILIILNVIAIILASFRSINNQFFGFFRDFEIFSVVVFSIEYLLRLWVSDVHYFTKKHHKGSKISARVKYIFSFYGIIDLIAILPFYLPVFIKLDLRMLRILRITRMFRLFKVAHYSKSLQLMGTVLKNKKGELLVTISIALIIVLVSSSLMYEIEKNVQPDNFPNVFAAMWWAFATLTTIGYGDVYPISVIGKILAIITAFFGIGLIAIPTGILASGFSEELQKKSKSKKEIPIKNTDFTFCPYCGKPVKEYHGSAK